MIYRFNFTATYEPRYFEHGLKLNQISLSQQGQVRDYDIHEYYTGDWKDGMQNPHHVVGYHGSFHTCGTPGDATFWLKSCDYKPGSIINIMAKKNYLLLRRYDDGLFLRGVYPSFKKLNSEFKKGDETILIFHNYAMFGEWDKTEQDIWGV